MSKILKRLVLILTLKCDQASLLMSDALDRELFLYERLALRGHLISCRVCRLLRKQFGVIHHAAGNCSKCEQGLSESANQRCKDAVRKAESE